MGLWNWLLSNRKKESPQRRRSSRAPRVKARRLVVEALEPRQLLGGDPSLTGLLAQDTPNPRPTGDPLAAAAQMITLTAYTAPPLFDPGIPALEPYFQGLQQIYNRSKQSPGTAIVLGRRGGGRRRRIPTAPLRQRDAREAVDRQLGRWQPVARCVHKPDVGRSA